MTTRANISTQAALVALMLAVPTGVLAQNATVSNAVQAFVRFCLNDAPEFQELRKINVALGNPDSSMVRLRDDDITITRVPSGPICYCEVGSPGLDEEELDKAVEGALTAKYGSSAAKTDRGWSLDADGVYLSVSIEAPSFVSREAGAYAQAVSGYDCRPVKGEAR